MHTVSSRPNSKKNAHTKLALMCNHLKTSEIDDKCSEGFFNLKFRVT